QAVAVVVDESDVLDAHLRSPPGPRDGTGPGDARATADDAPPLRGRRGYPPRVDVRQLATTMEARRDAFVDALRELVEVDSGTYTPAGVNRVADLLEARFGESGWATERRPHRPAEGSPQLGDLLVARVEGPGRHRVLVVCHMDTVWPEGTV